MHEEDGMPLVEEDPQADQMESFQNVPKNKSLFFKSDNLFDNLTSREVFENKLITYAGLALSLSNTYRDFTTDKRFAEAVELLTGSDGTANLNRTHMLRKSQRTYATSSLGSSYVLDMQIQSREFSIVEYAPVMFHSLRLVQGMDVERLTHALLPANNKDILVKSSFAKLGGRGGKPLMKTHDGRFFIKEITKEEKNVVLEFLINYHTHMQRNPQSLLAKIYGIFKVKIHKNKKFYHVLMQNLDPVEQSHVVLKYDMKFSTVQRATLK